MASILEGLCGDERSIEDSWDTSPRSLDRKTRCLVGIGAAASMGAPAATYRNIVRGALDAGATVEECIGAFVAVAPVVGAARMVTGAPRIGAALGYDVDLALECD